MRRTLIAAAAIAALLASPSLAHERQRTNDALAGFVFGTVFGVIVGSAMAEPKVVYRDRGHRHRGYRHRHYRRCNRAGCFGPGHRHYRGHRHGRPHRHRH